jgi:hypothetical protein
VSATTDWSASRRGTGRLLRAALTAGDSEIMARETPEAFKARFDRECLALDKLIKPVNVTINCAAVSNRSKPPLIRGNFGMRRGRVSSRTRYR